MTADELALRFAEEQPETTRRRELVWQDPMPTAGAGAEMAGIDYMRSIVAGEVPPPPIAVTMRFAPVEVEDRERRLRGRPRRGALQPDRRRPRRATHRRCSTPPRDARSTRPSTKGEAYTTLTLEVKMVRPILSDTGRVRAEAEVVHRGRRQATAEAKLFAVESEKLLATATSTCMIL